MIATATAKAGIEIDRESNTISMAREFAAPRERIFAAWTIPEQIARWWDPSGVPLAACEVDLRPGGRFRFVNQGSQAIPAFEGVYREIDPPRRIAFDAMGSIGTVALEDLGDRTLMTVSIRCGSPEQLKSFVAMGVDVGTARTLDNLVAYVADQRV